jgi:hypothetical protein
MTLPGLIHPTPQPLSGHRELSDEVLQSAEEAVLTNPQSVSAAPARDEAGAGPEGRREVRVALGPQGLAGYVATRPVRSAFMAGLTGALGAVLLQQVWLKKRR